MTSLSQHTGKKVEAFLCATAVADITAGPSKFNAGVGDGGWEMCRSDRLGLGGEELVALACSVSYPCFQIRFIFMDYLSTSDTIGVGLS